MLLERENAKSIKDPSAKRLALELRRLHGYGKSSFACLAATDGSYVQVAGGAVNCCIERRDPSSRRHYRAFQRPPVVPYQDGDKLRFSGGLIALRRGEWFFIEDVIAIFQAFLLGQPYPSKVQWRDVTDELADAGVARPKPAVV